MSIEEAGTLDKLLPPLEMTEPKPALELQRICALYELHVEHNSSLKVQNTFKDLVEKNLHLVLRSKEEFYAFGLFEEDYQILLDDFIEGNIDADESDFIEEYIEAQNEIINKTYRHEIEIDSFQTLEVTQFVSNDFFQEFIRSAKKKIHFLEGKTTGDQTSRNSTVETENPYPDYFKSYDIYEKFLEYTDKHIPDAYIDYSYLKKRLEAEGLTHRMKDLEFIEFLYRDMKLSDSLYEDFIAKGKLIALKKSSSVQRENNFNNIFK